MNDNLGRVHIFTGNGRGKSSASIGTAVRAAGYGHKVKMYFFLKGFHQGGEYAAFDKLDIEWKICGKPDLWGPEGLQEKDHLAFQECLSELEKDLLSQQYDLLILDEINVACAYKMLEFAKLIELVNKRGRTEVILSGRYASQELMDYADQVSSIENVKHAMQKGGKPKEGVDF